MDALHPGSVNLSKVDFNSRSEYDSINNYKALQAAFTKAGIDKPVDVARLVKARPLDNIEFMQWFKAYWDSQTGGGFDSSLEGYDARARRAASKTGDVRGSGSGNGNSGGGGAASTSSADGVAPSSLPPSSASQPSFSGRAATRAPLTSTSRGENRLTPSRNRASAAAATTAAAAGRKAPSTSTAAAATTATISELTSALAEARLRAAAAERERDFYFDKLRDVELLCGAPGLLEDEYGEPVSAAAAALKLVERVLFAADDAGAKEVLAEVGVVGTTGVTPPPSEVVGGEEEQRQELAT